MLNEIPIRQNLPEFIDKIAASSRAYGNVKKLSAWQSWLAISSAVVGPIIAYKYPDAKGWAALYAGALLLIDLILLEPAVKRYQELGAKIQEVFDTSLFGLPWNTHRCQAKPDPEVLIRLATKFKANEKTDRLEGWYPSAAGEVPIDYGRLVCQRANMQWDAALRRYYSAFFVVLLLLMAVACSSLALYMKWDATQIALMFIPFLPAAVKLIRECQKHIESANASERTKSMLESIWSSAIQSNVSADRLLEDSRRLQDEIYDRRKNSPTVPQWLYLWLKPTYENAMRLGSGEMVADAKAKLNIAQ